MRIDLQPVLASEALILRPLASGDFDALRLTASDSAVWEQHPSKDRVEEPR